MYYDEQFGYCHTWGRILEFYKVIIDGMVQNISLMLKVKSIGIINEYGTNLHGYYIIKLISLMYTLNGRKIDYGNILNES